MINVSHLTKKYKNTHANDNISFIVDSGEIAVLAGSNGAGKSTLMNILCGVIKQTEGQVLIHGIDVLKSPILAKECIGFLPQKPPLNMDLTVEEYLNFTANLRWIPAAEVSRAVKAVMGR